jgi:hypothetical protein
VPAAPGRGVTAKSPRVASGLRNGDSVEAGRRSQIAEGRLVAAEGLRGRGLGEQAQAALGEVAGELVGMQPKREGLVGCMDRSYPRIGAGELLGAAGALTGPQTAAGTGTTSANFTVSMNCRKRASLPSRISQMWTTGRSSVLPVALPVPV